MFIYFRSEIKKSWYNTGVNASVSLTGYLACSKRWNGNRDRIVSKTKKNVFYILSRECAYFFFETILTYVFFCSRFVQNRVIECFCVRSKRVFYAVHVSNAADVGEWPGPDESFSNANSRSRRRSSGMFWRKTWRPWLGGMEEQAGRKEKSFELLIHTWTAKNLSFFLYSQRIPFPIKNI